MAAIDEAIQQWQIIRDETQDEANTATRVGNAGLAILDALEEVSAAGGSGGLTEQEIITLISLSLTNYIQQDEVEGMISAITRCLYLTKTSFNGDFGIAIFSYPKNIQITGVTLMSNCESITVKIGENTYTSETLVNLTVPANTEIIIDEINILAGYSVGNARITFNEV